MAGPILIKGFPKLAKKGWKKLTADEGVLRLLEINKKLKETPEKAHVPGFTEKASVRQDVAEDFAQEVFDIYAGTWKDKK
tara:strand:+ start:35 stop:274 length:240 start_codon:yes stop_codon:yes gene_type:complete